MSQYTVLRFVVGMALVGSLADCALAQVVEPLPSRFQSELKAAQQATLEGKFNAAIQNYKALVTGLKIDAKLPSARRTEAVFDVAAQLQGLAGDKRLAKETQTEALGQAQDYYRDVLASKSVSPNERAMAALYLARSYAQLGRVENKRRLPAHEDGLKIIEGIKPTDLPEPDRFLYYYNRGYANQRFVDVDTKDAEHAAEAIRLYVEAVKHQPHFAPAASRAFGLLGKHPDADLARMTVEQMSKAGEGPAAVRGACDCLKSALWKENKLAEPLLLAVLEHLIRAQVDPATFAEEYLKPLRSLNAPDSGAGEETRAAAKQLIQVYDPKLAPSLNRNAVVKDFDWWTQKQRPAGTPRKLSFLLKRTGDYFAGLPADTGARRKRLARYCAAWMLDAGDDTVARYAAYVLSTGEFEDKLRLRLFDELDSSMAAENVYGDDIRAGWYRNRGLLATAFWRDDNKQRSSALFGESIDGLRKGRLHTAAGRLSATADALFPGKFSNQTRATDEHVRKQFAANPGSAKLEAVGAIAYGSDSMLLVRDPRGRAIWLVDQAGRDGKLEHLPQGPEFGRLLADFLKLNPTALRIAGVARDPRTRSLYFSVPSAKPPTVVCWGGNREFRHVLRERPAIKISLPNFVMHGMTYGSGQLIVTGYDSGQPKQPNLRAVSLPGQLTTSMPITGLPLGRPTGPAAIHRAGDGQAYLIVFGGGPQLTVLPLADVLAADPGGARQFQLVGEQKLDPRPPAGVVLINPRNEAPRQIVIGTRTTGTFSISLEQLDELLSQPVGDGPPTLKLMPQPGPREIEALTAYDDHRIVVVHRDAKTRTLSLMLRELPAEN